MKLNLLNIQPIKKIPDRLIYLNSVNKTMRPEQLKYIIFSTKTGKHEGEMLCHKTKMNLRDDYNGSSLAVDFLMANKRKQGVGTAFINFAKFLSRQMGCNGHIVLKADPFFTPNSAPHVFYRKCGFSTLDKKQDKKIDNYIKKHKDANWKDMLPTLMFYPEYHEKKQSFIKTLFKFFRVN